MTVQTARKVHSTVKFRADLPWFDEPLRGQGAWYRYDGGRDVGAWTREYYTCEWAPEYGGGRSCWPNGA